jgi:hypothetical protein
MVAAGTDAQKLRPAAARVLPRHQADPSRKVSAAAELARVADAGHQGRGDDRADTRQRREPAAGLARPAELDDAVVERGDPDLQRT